MFDQTTPRPTALTIAGYDPSGGAGITADLAAFAVHGIFGTSAITALTVQSTTGVRSVHPVDAAILTATLRCLGDDLPPAGIKIGMLAGAEQARAVAGFLRAMRAARPSLYVVVDPILLSSSGAQLLSPEGRTVLVDEILPLADVVTPNTEELATITGLPCADEQSILKAAEELAKRGKNLAVLVTGGHRPQPDDLLLRDGRLTVLAGQRIETRATHGTGCALSSALLCGLIAGDDLFYAATKAKQYVRGAMLFAAPRGQGKGPMNLQWSILGHRQP